VKLLLENYPGGAQQKGLSDLPFHAATNSGHVEVVELLIQNFPDEAEHENGAVSQSDPQEVSAAIRCVQISLEGDEAVGEVQALLTKASQTLSALHANSIDFLLPRRGRWASRGNPS
jgi:hypothetical protein